jgi:hypothetical protein
MLVLYQAKLALIHSVLHQQLQLLLEQTVASPCYSATSFATTTTAYSTAQDNKQNSLAASYDLGNGFLVSGAYQKTTLGAIGTADEPVTSLLVMLTFITCSTQLVQIHYLFQLEPLRKQRV